MHPLLVIALVLVGLWVGYALLVGAVMFWGTGGFDQRTAPTHHRKK